MYSTYSKIISKYNLMCMLSSYILYTMQVLRITDI